MAPNNSSPVIFISYASSDNGVPDGKPPTAGFVSFLHRNLLYELATELGLGDDVLLWRDRMDIHPGDEWSDAIEAALQEADALVIILSPAYTKRVFCKRELETFLERPRASGITESHKRIFCVKKHRLEPNELGDLFTSLKALNPGTNLHPVPAEPLQGVFFFNPDEKAKPPYEPFYWRGAVRNKKRFEGAVRELALGIERVIRPLLSLDAAQAHQQPQVRPAPPSNGRTVFVAEPGRDLEDAYHDLVTELQERGYRVVPLLESRGLPDHQAEAEQMVMQALEEAEIAVHLLGDRIGSTPEGGDCGIVPLQLKLSAAHVAKKPAFKRIIWAPRFVVQPDLSEDPATLPKPAPKPAMIDPLDRLEKMGGTILSQDQLDGGPMAEFREFLILLLEAKAKPPPYVPPSGKDVKHRVYVLHHNSDSNMALSVAKMLRSCDIVPLLPQTDGEPQEVKALHARRLSQCDAVVVCWGEASGSWVECAADELRDYRLLDRDTPFQNRVVVLGGEPTAAKLKYADVYPDDVVDAVLNGTSGSIETAIKNFADMLLETCHG
jgi:hypothetical protein